MAHPKQKRTFTSSETAKWLKSREGLVVPPWIRAVRKATERIPATADSRPMESAQLIRFFDSIVTCLKTGDVAELDASLQTLVTDRLGRGYALADFMHMASELKSNIWEIAHTELSPPTALAALAALEPVFNHSTSRLAWLASRAAEARLEEELERTRFSLAKLDRVKSDFISIAAHELKTPLTLVQGYAAMLETELYEQQHLDSVLGGLNRGIRRLYWLIQDMIDVSLIDSNVLTLLPQPVSLLETVRLAVGDLEQEAADRHVTIEIGSFPDEAKEIYLDPKRMYQVFTNLVGNAVKYTPDSRTITITTRVLQSPKQGIRFVEVAIADTGIGIAADDLPHIFRKFYRVGHPDLHSTSKTQFKGGGPGLGLAIAKGIVEAHGGRIWAESPGYDEQRCPGSTFRVMLPLHLEPPASPAERLPGLEHGESGE